ncbi:alpha-glucoside transport system permease protein [Meinhardsimonia xiamenensis]|jgi:alpha-glucoside transport system permease protein|uniref:Alpha-glucoside transport system permease protein n=1 Tax=Meinhardsimonia xiamenensis TaxID=990712 RepID=A0A1G9D6F6_9RHOB|nr:carbohydrate ABC transporter permease [Meinhardsimonia xiamenensis]PRX38119.1 alpha-glucoside transport system permease protein [Meinhardsimonia xiamenensis]SDK59294.1 alpha-glucoside transport system permease protein [Meinhardsimonia xiamenensis]
MDNIAGTRSALGWAVNLSVLALVLLWLFPTVGLFVSSFRTADQIATTGWWKALVPAEQNLTLRTAPPETQREENGRYVIAGNLFLEDGREPAEISAWGISSRAIDAYRPGETAELRRGGTITVEANGDYRMESAEPFTGSRGQRVFVTAEIPPEFTLENYDKVLGKGVVKRLAVYALAALIFAFAVRWSLRDREGWLVAALPTVAGLALLVALSLVFGLSEGEAEGAQTTDNMSRAFFSTLTVVIPATVIPITIAAFAAYALAWMEFPGRALLIAAVVGLLVVPLQLALIPLLKLHLAIGIGKGYLGVWLAHTGFGLPLAIYLLRNYMVGLPRDIIECAKVDGATDFQIFARIVLPLSFPALASFAIFQFLWTWNDLLVAKVFLIDATGETTVMTNAIVELLGTRGGNWEILATAAFVSMAVPLVVFFAMQKYLVRGLLAGSVK